MKMQIKSRLGVCLLIAVLGLIAVATAIAAEFKRTKGNEVRYEDGECSLPGSPALALGTTAAISLLISQIIANTMGGCVCCCKRDLHKIPARNKAIAMFFLTFSWISFGCALYLLVAGSSMNQSQSYGKQWLDNECYVVKTGVFAGAAALSLATVLFSVVFYLAVTTRETEGLPIRASVAPVAKSSSES